MFIENPYPSLTDPLGWEKIADALKYPLPKLQEKWKYLRKKFNVPKPPEVGHMGRPPTNSLDYESLSSNALNNLLTATKLIKLLLLVKRFV